MNMKQWAINLLLGLLSVAAIGIALFKITPFEISEETYIGTIVSLLSLAVAFIIGYQIYNAIELKNEIKEQKARYDKIMKENEIMKKEYRDQKNQMDEGFSILSALIKENEGQSSLVYSEAFYLMHHALINSIEIERADNEWIFNKLRSYIIEFSYQTFTHGYCNVSGEFIINECGKNKGKTLEDVIREYLIPIKEDEKLLRCNKNFYKIKIEYNRVMKIFYKRMSEIAKNPEIRLSPEEEDLIINPI